MLDNSKEYLKNNKIHIVAAPGSGKTILGLELIRRLNSPCLVLSPTNTIKFQWRERFEEMFLPKNEKIDDYVSFDLKQIRPITSITYQALHSAVDKVVCEDEDGEIVDYSDIDLLKTMKLNDIKVICVDEAHHLQNEWQKALDKFISSLGQSIKVIALTATPPYDATDVEWDRYIRTCGDIDEEIFVTELVKAKNLCPHQDYVYLNYPTLEESEFFKQHYDCVNECIDKLKTFPILKRLGDEILKKKHPEYILNERNGFLSVFGMLKYFGMSFDEKTALNTLKEKQFQSNLVMCEKALNYMLTNEHLLSTEDRGKLKAILKTYKLIEKNEVKLVLNSTLEKTITYSLGKLESINKIVRCELNSQKDNLRMLILTDYIRKKDQSKIGTKSLFKDISIVSIFETLRREFGNDKLGVLSGTFAVFPTSLEESVRKLITNKKSLVCRPIGDIGYSEYVFNMSNKEKVKIVGKIFEDGLISILVGTKSLLGEGWDSPCINSLILASFVGSFMLSNQMRGRAIRVYKKDENKTANIWHLVTLNPDFSDTNQENIVMTEYSSSDYKTLKRRFECFVGPHYEKKLIRNGLGRVSILKEFMTREDLERINSEMELRAINREEMSKCWFDNSTKSDRMYIETSIPNERVSRGVSFLSFPNACISFVLLMISISLKDYSFSNIVYEFLSNLATIIFSVTTCFYLFKLLFNFSRILFVKSVASAIQKGLLALKILKNKCKQKIRYNWKEKSIDVILISNNLKEQKKFSEALSEFFTAPTSKERYAVIKKLYGNYVYKYSYQVPDELAKNRNSAKLFGSYLLHLKNIGVVYLKNSKKLSRRVENYSYLNFGCRPITQRQNSI